VIDLHIHTLASDGQHTGREVVEMSVEMGLRAIAIADHNSVESVGECEAAARELGIEFAPCTELDTIFRGRDLHVLGYFIEYDSEPCKQYFQEIFNAKMAQTELRVQKLQELGFLIELDKILELSGGRLPYGVEYIGAMLKIEENKNDPRVREYIDGSRSDSPYKNFYLDWLKAGRPAFVPLEAQPVERAMEKIKELGGIPVLAHPSDTPVDDVHALIDAGCMGLEVYSSYHDRELSEKFLKIAKDRDVLVTAGSDFHGAQRKPEVKLAGIPGNDYVLFERLKEAASK
jgi:predicted metal-dependent phosphoesterase TrpH